MGADPLAGPEHLVQGVLIKGAQWTSGVSATPNSQENTSFKVCTHTVSREKVHGFQEILSGIRNPKLLLWRLLFHPNTS